MKFIFPLIFTLCFVLPTLAEKHILQSLEEIAALPDNTPPVQFDIIGQIISTHSASNRPHKNPGITIINGAHRIDLGDLATTNEYGIGDIVSITGFVNRDPAHGEDGIFATRIVRQGHADLPTPKPFEQSKHLSSVKSVSPFSIEGVVSDVFQDELSSYTVWITLQTDIGPVDAFADQDEYHFEKLNELIDAEIEINGVRSLVPHRLQKAHNETQLYGTNGIRIIKMSSIDPHYAPEFPSGSLHRQRTSGIIQGKTNSEIFLTTSQGMLVTVHLTGTSNEFAVGDSVTIAGFPVVNRYGTSFVNAIASKESSPVLKPLKPISITGKQLADDPVGREPINYRYHGKFISIKGILRSDDSETSSTGILRLDCDNREIKVDLTGLIAEKLPHYKCESVLEVTGICIIEFENDGTSLGLPRFRRYRLIPRSNADIRLVARPKGWVISVLLITISLLVALLIAVLVWTKSLKVLSERRGHELSLALTARIRAESRTQERTRLALELHDSISQSLTGVALQIDAATTNVQIDPERRNTYLTTAKNLLASCRKALQDCLWDLRSRTFEEKDLTEAISRTLAPFLSKCTILVRFNIPSESLSESAMHAVLSIIRELTANAIRHGNASYVRIAGEFKDGRVRFSVTDNGTGFDVTHAPGPHDGHFGLQGIHERVNDFEGTVNLMSAAGKGTRVIVTLVIDNEKERPQ